jgi:glutamine---fructose-6-phosphate transaminase (isomerizing)
MNDMAAQIYSLPDLIRYAAVEYAKAIRAALPPQLSMAARRIYLTGCGDSHHAALGAELAFEHLAGIPTEALSALQYSRYAADSMPKGEPGANLVIGISVSGEVARTYEALQCGRKQGAVTIALTAAPASRVGQAGEYRIDTTQPPFAEQAGVVIPGVRSFVANQISLLLLAVYLGEGRRHLSGEEGKALRQEIYDLGSAAEETIQACAVPAALLAQEWQDAQEFVFVGGGPNFASALFCAAKVLEASGDPALGQDTEEWAHLQYFARRADTPTFLISAGARDLSRMGEVAAAGRAIGRRTAAVAPLSAQSIVENAAARLPLAEGVREMFSPVVSAIPGSLFAAFRAEVIQEPFFRDFEGGRSREGGGGISRIRTSETICDHSFERGRYAE